MNTYHKLFLLSAALAMYILTFSCSMKQDAGNKTQDTDITILADKPTMGWNSWDCFYVEVNEEQVRAAADYMAENLLEFGYEYIVVDLGWYLTPETTTDIWQQPRPDQSLDAFGRLMPDVKKFPSASAGMGFKPLADYVHSKGLKFGIHIMRGIPYNAVEQNLPIKGTQALADDINLSDDLCEWSPIMEGVDVSTEAGKAYYRSLVELYVSWGVDFIKADDFLRPYHTAEIEAFSEAVRNADRQIVLSYSPGATPINQAAHIAENANMWRISNDFWDDWSLLKKQFAFCASWAPYIKQGAWPDADMLPVGKLRIPRGDEWTAELLHDEINNTVNEYSRFTISELQTMMNLWSIFKSPLMIGGFIPENDSISTAILTNKDIIDINQNSVGNQLVYSTEDESVWLAASADGSTKYVAAFNISETPRSVKIPCQDLGLSPTIEYHAEDVWSKKEISISEFLSADLNPHASILYKIHVEN